jgi:hypothetical protein
MQDLKAIRYILKTVGNRNAFKFRFTEKLNN